MNKLLVIFFGLLLSFGNLAICQTENHRIDNAVGLRVTQRGQDVFKNNLLQLLFLNGVPVNSFYVDMIEFAQPEPVSLSPVMQEYLDIINLGFIGLDLKASQIRTQIEDFEASVHFDELSLRFFPTQFNIVEGGGEARVMALLTAKISSFRTEVGSILADDLANPFLGNFGFTNFSLSSSPDTRALEMTVPVFITVVKGRDDVGLSVGTITSSLSAFDLGYSFTSPAILPDVEISINGSRIQLDKNALSNELLVKQDRLLRFVKSELDIFIQNDLPVKINGLLKEKIFNKFSEINLLTPVGANLEHNGVNYNPIDPDDLFQWKIRLDELEVIGQDLVASLSADVRDPRAAKNIPMPMDGSSRSRLISEALKYPDDQYDVAISLNQGFLNRFLALSFNRGFFENIPTGEVGKKTEFIHISKSPLVRFDLSEEGSDVVRVQIEIRPEVSGLQRLAVNSQFRVSIVANIKIEKRKDGHALIVESIDENFSYDKSGLRLSLFKSQVDKGVLESIRAINALAPKPVLAEDIPVPKSLLGMPAQLKHISPSKTGYINFFYEYGEF